MNDVYAIGTGHTKFGKLNQNLKELLQEVTQEVLTNSNLSIDEIDAIIVANFSSGFVNQCHLPALLASILQTNKEIIRVESACATGAVAIKEATLYLQSGGYKNVMVVGVEKMTEVSVDKATQILATAGSPKELQHGATFPSLYALMAQAYFAKYKVGEKDLAKVAVKNHNNAFLNPLAHFHKKITMKSVLDSKIIASPLKLFDCSPLSDGAAAIILSTEKSAVKASFKPIRLTGFGHAVDKIELFKRQDLTSMPVVNLAAKKAFKMAGITAKDVDLAEVHDCFTIAELIEMEELGFVKKGDAVKWLKKGFTKIKGKLPINPSGGLKAKGHPIGATGVSQAVEIVKQLQGKAGKRQVRSAKVGLSCNVGGSGGSCVVTIFSN